MAPSDQSQSRNLADWIHDLQSPLAALRAIRRDELAPPAEELVVGAIASLEKIVVRMKGEAGIAAPVRGAPKAEGEAAVDVEAGDEIIIPTGAVVAVLDDDPAIHLAWRSRFEGLPRGAIERIVTASTPQQLRLVMREFPDLFLVDHDLAGHSETGLDLIIELGIARQAWLVTGRALEPSIRERCARHGVRLLSKEKLTTVRLRIQG